MSAPGEVSGEIFPGTYSFEMQYKATVDHVTNVSVPLPAGAHTTLTWQPTSVTIAWAGSVSYGPFGSTGDTTWFDSTAPTATTVGLFPGTYTFHFRDYGGVVGSGDLNFHSSSYQWLVVNQNGTNAQFKGTGTINGVGNFKFMIWAGGGGSDTFRIKIWAEEAGVETVVYDNGTDQPIGGGNIVVHT